MVSESADAGGALGRAGGCEVSVVGSALFEVAGMTELS